MRCSLCGAEGMCWYDAHRRLVCRACRDAALVAARDARWEAMIGQRRIWSRFTSRYGEGADEQVTVVGHRGAWLIVCDAVGVDHRVREHSISRVAR